MSKISKQPDYEGFCEHVEEWKKLGIPYGVSDLIRLSNKYHTPIPERILNMRLDDEIL